MNKERFWQGLITNFIPQDKNKEKWRYYYQKFKRIQWMNMIIQTYIIEGRGQIYQLNKTSQLMKRYNQIVNN